MCWVFGGHTNPLVYSRVATFAARTAQALLINGEAEGLAEARLQLYVDDPALTVAGSPTEQHRTIDVFVLWLLVLGIPLSWSKGVYADKLHHTWIGVTFASREPGTCTMTVPETFRTSLLALARTFSDEQVRTQPIARAQQLCGRMGRSAQIIPATRPFGQALFAALAGALRNHAAGGREAPPGKVATRRFRTAAKWLVRLLEPDQNREFMPLEYTLVANPTHFDLRRRRVEFDASPWGAGGVLFDQDQPSEFFFQRWTKDSSGRFRLPIGRSEHQTFWELAALVLCLVQWGWQPLALLRDNSASLQHALSGEASSENQLWPESWLGDAPNSSGAFR